jgi:TetR/AcrR family transcriptional repressor of nem operon
MRPRKYQENESLDRAMGVFHRFGYRGTTLEALLRATGMGRGSLYCRFQDKHELYMAVLARYRRTVVKPHLDRLEACLSPKGGILELFDRAASSGDGHDDPLGSLITNAAVELAPHDARVRAVVADHFADVEATFTRAVERAQALGEVSRQKDAIKIAHGLLGGLQGLLVLARAGLARRGGRQTAAAVLDGDEGGVCPQRVLRRRRRL